MRCCCDPEVKGCCKTRHLAGECGWPQTFSGPCPIAALVEYREVGTLYGETFYVKTTEWRATVITDLLNSLRDSWAAQLRKVFG